MTKRDAQSVVQLRRLLKGLSVGMFTTHTSEGETHSRPMLVQDLDTDGWLWFLTDRSSRKACELSRNPETAVIFQSPAGDRYVTVHGMAVVVRDSVKLKRLWHATFRAWFPKGRRDPEISLIAVKVDRADYWVVPKTRIARAVGAAKALATGRRYEAGRHGTLQIA